MGRVKNHFPFFYYKNRYDSDSGKGPRREADRWIEEGRVTLNGKPAELGSKVRPGDEVRLDGELLQPNEPLVYILLNKPVGITCTTERDVEDNIIDYMDHPLRIFPVGRLDKMSEGLILLTNDGDIVNQILRAGNAHDKEYQVLVDRCKQTLHQVEPLREEEPGRKRLVFDENLRPKSAGRDK